MVSVDWHSGPGVTTIGQFADDVGAGGVVEGAAVAPTEAKGIADGPLSRLGEANDDAGGLLVGPAVAGAAIDAGGSTEVGPDVGTFDVPQDATKIASRPALNRLERALPIGR